MVFQNAVHMVQVDACVEIACRKRLAAGFELLQADGKQDQKRRFCKLCDHPDHDDRAAAERREDKQLGKAYAHEDQTCLPVERQMDCAVGNAGSNCPQRARKKAQDIENDRVFPERAGFEARCKRHENAHNQQHREDQQHRDHKDRNGNACAGQLNSDGKKTRTARKGADEIKVQRNPVDPVEVDARNTVFMPCRAQQEDKQCQAHGKRNGSDGNQSVPVFHQKVRIIRLLIDIVLRRQGASDVARDGYMLIVEALVGNIGVDLLGACLFRGKVSRGLRGDILFGRRGRFLCGCQRSRGCEPGACQTFSRLRCFAAVRNEPRVGRDIRVVDVEILPFERVEVFLIRLLRREDMVVFYNVAPVIRQVLLLTARILIRFVLIGAFKDGFAGIILHGEEEVAVFARELLLVIRKRRAAAAGTLLQDGGIIVGGSVHRAVERISCNMVLREALGVAVAALIGKIQDPQAAEKEDDGKDREQKQRRYLCPELALQLFHLGSASIL